MIAAFASFFVKGVCGFANTLVLQSILSFRTDNIVISPVELLLSFPANAMMTIKERRHIRWKLCLPVAAIVLAGCIPGIFLLKNVDTTSIKIIFGIMVVAIAIEMFFRDKRKNNGKSNKILMWGIGILSGILCGLYGVGALLSAYFGRTTDNIHEFKANISFVFVCENILRTIIYSAVGILTFDILKMALMIVPFVIGGLALGMFCGKFINENIVKKIVIVMLALSGVSLIVTSL